MKKVELIKRLFTNEEIVAIDNRNRELEEENKKLKEKQKVLDKENCKLIDENVKLKKRIYQNVR